MVAVQQDYSGRVWRDYFVMIWWLYFIQYGGIIASLNGGIWLLDSGLSWSLFGSIRSQYGVEVLFSQYSIILSLDNCIFLHDTSIHYYNVYDEGGDYFGLG